MYSNYKLKKQKMYFPHKMSLHFSINPYSIRPLAPGYLNPPISSCPLSLHTKSFGLGKDLNAWPSEKQLSFGSTPLVPSESFILAKPYRQTWRYEIISLNHSSSKFTGLWKTFNFVYNLSFCCGQNNFVFPPTTLLFDVHCKIISCQISISHFL